MTDAAGHQPVDTPFDEAGGAGGDEDGAHPLQVGGVQPAVTDTAVEEREGRPVAALHGARPADREQIGVLAFPDVAAGRFAGPLLVPEHPIRSSWNWKATPAQRPAALSARVVGSSAPASAAPRASGRSTEYRALLRYAVRTASATGRSR